MSRDGTKTGNTIIPPEQLRKLTAEDLRALGIETYNPTLGKAGLVNLSLAPDEAIQIEPDPAGGANKIIRVLKNAKFDEATGRWKG
jgi:hypothetical protein